MDPSASGVPARIVPGMTALLLLGTLDTKGTEYAYLRERVRGHGVEVVLADVGLGEPAGVDPDLSRIEVAAETGADPVTLLAAGDRGAAVAAMAEGAAALAARLYARGAHRRRARRGRLGRHGDRHRRDARAAGRRAEADGLHDGRRRRRATTSAART